MASNSHEPLRVDQNPAFKQCFHGRLAAGVYFARSAFEAGFVSSAHGDVEIDATLAAAEKVFARL